MRVVFISQIPFHERYRERFVTPLAQRGFDVRIIDCTAYMRPSSYTQAKLPGQSDYKDTVPCDTLEKAVSAIKSIQPDEFAFSLIHLDKRALPLYSALRGVGLGYGVYQITGLPNPFYPLRPTGLEARLHHMKSRWSSGSKIRRTLSHIPGIPSSLVGVCDPALMFVNSSMLGEIMYPVGPKTRIIRTASHDHDVYMAWLRQENKVPVLPPSSKQRVVFLENVTPADPHYPLTGKKGTPVTADVYYPEIITFLKNFVKDHDMDLTVAAHPKALYKGRLEYYQDFNIVQGKSLQAAHEADIVLSHATMSVGYAVLAKKPLIFLTTDQLNSGKHGPYVHAQARALGMVPVNITHTQHVTIDEAMRVDDQRYEQYLHDYIREQGETRPFWDIAAEAIHSLAAERV